MASLTSRTEFTEYCLRRLGWPVIDLNLDDEQIDDRVDDAIQYWQDYHFDGTQKFYYIHMVTDQDVAQQYLDLSNVVDSQNNALDIIGVTRIFPLQDSQATINMFDLRYQLRLNELYDFTSASYVNYTLTQQHLRSLEILFTGEVPIQFNRHMKRLFINWAWGSQEAPAGSTIVTAECYANLNPEVYTAMWNDRWLKLYATALIKRQWGMNLKKYKEVPMLGGVKLSGQEIYDEAYEEIRMLEDQMETQYGAPLEWFMN